MDAVSTVSKLLKSWREVDVVSGLKSLQDVAEKGSPTSIFNMFMGVRDVLVPMSSGRIEASPPRLSETRLLSRERKAVRVVCSILNKSGIDTQYILDAFDVQYAKRILRRCLDVHVSAAPMTRADDSFGVHASHVIIVVSHVVSYTHSSSFRIEDAVDIGQLITRAVDIFVSLLIRYKELSRDLVGEALAKTSSIMIACACSFKHDPLYADIMRNMFAALLLNVAPLVGMCRDAVVPKPQGYCVQMVLSALAMMLYKSRSSRLSRDAAPYAAGIVKLIEVHLRDVLAADNNNGRLQKLSAFMHNIVALGAISPDIDAALMPRYFDTMRRSLLGIGSNQDEEPVEYLVTALQLSEAELASVTRLLSDASDWVAVRDKLKSVLREWPSTKMNTWIAAITTILTLANHNDAYWAAAASDDDLRMAIRRATKFILNKVPPAVICWNIAIAETARHDLKAVLARLSKCAACGVSGKVPLKVRTCAGCLRVCYCSRDCQVRHWRTAGHRKACWTVVRDRLATFVRDGVVPPDKKAWVTKFARYMTETKTSDVEIQAIIDTAKELMILVERINIDIDCE
jgi:MYND finger